MNPDDLQSFDDFQKSFPQAIRNPFQKESPVQTQKASDSEKPSSINLTWKYKLTGIGFDKGKYATIDHNNYYEGDKIHGMRIDRILNDRVHLTSEDGKTTYLIAFRYKGSEGGR